MPERSASSFSVSPRLLIFAILGGVVSVFAVWILASRVDTATVMSLLARADAFVLLAAVGSLSVSMILRTQRWRSIYPASTNGYPALQRMLPVVLVGYALNQVLPLRLGDIGRAAIGARRFGSGIPETLGSVGLERLIDAAALGILGVAVSIGVLVPDWLTASSMVIVIAAAVAVVVLSAIALRIGAHRSSPGWRVVEGLHAAPRAMATSGLTAAAAWGFDAVTVWLVASSIQVDMSWQIAMVITVAAAIGAILPSAPAAIGTFHLAATAAGVAMGVPAAAALAVVTLWHAITVLPLVVAGAACAPTMGLGIRDLRGASGEPVQPMSHTTSAAAGEAR